MTTTLPIHDERCKPDTPAAENELCVILGPHRLRGSNWAEVLAMARNGYAIIRSGRDVRLCWSGAYETDELQ